MNPAARLCNAGLSIVRRILPRPVKYLVRTSIARVQDRIESNPQLVRVSRDKPLPVSMKIEDSWHRFQDPAANAQYVVTDCARISGSLDPDLLRDCWGYMVKRHEILRSNFVDVGGLRIRQMVGPPEPVQMPLVEIAPEASAWEAIHRIAEEEKAKLSRLDPGPLTRFVLLRVGEDEHWLLRTFHHFLGDRWASRLLRRELARLYEAGKEGSPAPLPETEPLQFADYASWQRKICRPGGHLHRGTINYWHEIFADNPPPLDLPFRRQAPISGVDSAEGSIAIPIDKETEDRMNRLGRSEAATLYIIWLAALVAQLLRETNLPDVIINSPMTSRLRHPALVNMVGDFSNPTALRFYDDRTKSFRALVAEVASQVRAALEHCEIPDFALRNALRGRGTGIPEPRLVFEAHTGDLAGTMDFAGLRYAKLGLVGPMPTGFHIHVLKHHGEQSCQAVFDPNLYEPASARKFVEHLCKFAEAASRDPDRPIGDLTSRP